MEEEEKEEKEEEEVEVEEKEQAAEAATIPHCCRQSCCHHGSQIPPYLVSRNHHTIRIRLIRKCIVHRSSLNPFKHFQGCLLVTDEKTSTPGLCTY